MLDDSRVIDPEGCCRFMLCLASHHKSSGRSVPASPPPYLRRHCMYRTSSSSCRKFGCFSWARRPLRETPSAVVHGRFSGSFSFSRAALQSLNHLRWASGFDASPSASPSSCLSCFGGRSKQTKNRQTSTRRFFRAPLHSPGFPVGACQGPLEAPGASLEQTHRCLSGGPDFPETASRVSQDFTDPWRARHAWGSTRSAPGTKAFSGAPHGLLGGFPECPGDSGLATSHGSDGHVLGILPP